MNPRRPFSRLVTAAALAAASTLAFAAPVRAQPAELRVLASNGMRAVIESLLPEIERSTPTTPIEFDTTAALRGRIEAGAPFDAVVITTEAIDALAEANRVAPDSVVRLGRSAVGVGVKAGAPKPDVSSADAIKGALLAAKAPTWVAAGATRPRVDRMLRELGIADAVAAKLVLADSVANAVELVRSGKADLMIMLASEVVPIAGVEWAGPLPGEFASYVSFAGAASPSTPARAAADRFVAALRSPDARRVYEQNGMELPGP